jgi:hypothetical protein
MCWQQFGVHPPLIGKAAVCQRVHASPFARSPGERQLDRSSRQFKSPKSRPGLVLLFSRFIADMARRQFRLLVTIREEDLRTAMILVQGSLLWKLP